MRSDRPRRANISVPIKVVLITIFLVLFYTETCVALAGTDPILRTPGRDSVQENPRYRVCTGGYGGPAATHMLVCYKKTSFN